ncbi:hypothetical protein E4T56_gene13650, partial [Termitomyces sp. T112]
SSLFIHITCLPVFRVKILRSANDGRHCPPNPFYRQRILQRPISQHVKDRARRALSPYYFFLSHVSVTTQHLEDTTMLDPTYPLYPIFTFTGCVLVLIPLPWHLQAWNSGTCFYMIWAALACLNQFVNSVVWANNAINTAPIWCDISIRIMLGASVGLPAASLCINRRLYEISSVQSVAVSRAEKRRAVLDDTLICVLFPVVFIALRM